MPPDLILWVGAGSIVLGFCCIIYAAVDALAYRAETAPARAIRRMVDKANLPLRFMDKDTPPMLALLPLIAALAPLAASAIGSALGGGAGKEVARQIEPAVTQAAIRVFGTADEAEAMREARKDPGLANEFAKEMAAIAAQAQAIEAQVRIAEMENDFKNVQDARAHQARLAAVGSSAQHGATVISFVVVVGFMTVLTLMIWRPFTLDAISSQILNIMVGVLAGSFTGVVNFWIGSSRGAQEKDRSIAENAGRAVDALRDRPVPVPPVVVAPVPAPIGPSAPAPAPTPLPAVESSFTSVIGELLRDEGGYVDNPADPGGCTNYGITLATLQSWRGPGQQTTCDDIKILTEAEAREIYFTKYWSALQCDNLPEGLNYFTFDMGVNAGIKRAASTLQACLQKRDATLAVDGVIGPLTLAIVAKVPARALLDEMHSAKMKFYQGLSTWPTFGKGWTARADRVLAKARAMIETT